MKDENTFLMLQVKNFFIYLISLSSADFYSGHIIVTHTYKIRIEE